MSDFQQVSENVERAVTCAWRREVPDWVPENTDAMSVGHDDRGSTWRFSMFLRICGQWIMVGHEIDAVEYDPLDGDTQDSPLHVAQRVADELLSKMFEKIGKLKRGGAFDACL